MLESSYISTFLQSHLSGYKNLFTKKTIKLKSLKTISKAIVTSHENMSSVQVS